MTQHDALLAAVCAAPDDDLPRLVYADWCDENGDPDRAEFIRLQIAIANGATGKKLATLQKREVELLSLYSDELTNMLKKFTDDFFADPFRFRRGFVEDISISGELLTEHGDELFELAPIRSLRIGDEEQLNDLKGV